MIPYLIEIRRRIFYCLIFLMLVFCISAFYANKIYYFLALPLLHHLTNHTGLIATTIPAPFLIPFKSAFMLSVFVTIPFCLYQLWAFVTPALYTHEKTIVWPLLILSSILFLIGVAFAYEIVLPLMFKFFIKTAPKGVTIMPDISQYFDFVMRMFLSFGFAFEVPIIITLLVRFNIFKIETLTKQRPYVILLAFILGMLLTPDVISQTLLAIPLWLLFEGGIILARIILARSSAPCDNHPSA